MEFWWGKRQAHARYTKLIHTPAGERFIAVVYDRGQLHRVGGRFETREAAARAATAWMRRRGVIGTAG